MTLPKASRDTKCIYSIFLWLHFKDKHLKGKNNIFLSLASFIQKILFVNCPMTPSEDETIADIVQPFTPLSQEQSCSKSYDILVIGKIFKNAFALVIMSWRMSPKIYFRTIYHPVTLIYHMIICMWYILTLLTNKL